MKKLACVLGHHAPVPDEVRNQGFAFTRCRHCRRDLVRSAKAWRTVPKGFRVVWRPGKRKQAEQSAAQLLLNLPQMPGRALTVVHQAGEGGLPLGFISLAGAGLRMLLWRLDDRFRRRARAGWPAGRARPPVLRLPAR